jgi:methyltransferase (TIGR00027 family)
MISGQSSRTAEYVAFFRACESVRPKHKRLFFDPFAKHFIRRSLRIAVWFSKIPLLGASVPSYADRRLPGARSSAIARTRLIDDATTQALQENIRQIVILGAGFDCRAYRLPGINSTTVFEVDHQATLAWKLSCLRAALPQLPPNVRFVQADFNRESVPQLLAQAGFDASLPAMFLWEGVSNYLTSEAVDAVLRTVSSCAPTAQSTSKEHRSCSTMSNSWENPGPSVSILAPFPNFSGKEACNWIATPPQASIARSFTAPMPSR